MVPQENDARNILMSKLYEQTCKLAYTESQVAISPRRPFGVADQTKLADQAFQLAEEAKRIRGLDPASVEEAKVHAALTKVAAAQAMFDLINNQTGNDFTTKQVFAAVEAALNALRVI